MTQLNRLSACLAATLLLALAVCPPALSADEGEEKELGWSDSAELTYVLTTGNSETTSLGFKNTLMRTWERALFKSRIAAVRAETTFVTRRDATGSRTDFVVNEEERTETTAETYFIDGRYDRKITDRFFWYALASWFRNQPAGIQDRYVGAAGVGNIWFEHEDLKFSTDYGATITKQEDVDPVPGVDDTFPGLRFHWYYLNQWGKNTTYENELYLDLNVDETSDWRGSNDNSLTVAMSERLGIKLGLTFLYQNEPAVEFIPLTGPGVPAGTTVPFQLDKLDTIFTTALVMNF
jgi:putative salt-induced outer membrane protein YdiY